MRRLQATAAPPARHTGPRRSSTACFLLAAYVVMVSPLSNFCLRGGGTGGADVRFFCMQSPFWVPWEGRRAAPGRWSLRGGQQAQRSRPDSWRTSSRTAPFARSSRARAAAAAGGGAGGYAVSPCAEGRARLSSVTRWLSYAAVGALSSEDY